jgi:hypothetical protein
MATTRAARIAFFMVTRFHRVAHGPGAVDAAARTSIYVVTASYLLVGPTSHYTVLR